jgi:hypothetical protein
MGFVDGALGATRSSAPTLPKNIPAEKTSVAKIQNVICFCLNSGLPLRRRSGFAQQ